MKKSMIFAVALAAMAASAADELWSIVRPEGGFHYISIDQNLESFSFDILKYENCALNGHTGYFVYTDGMSGRELTQYIKENGVDIAKNQASVDVGPLNAGDKVGFYKWDTTGYGRNQQKTIGSSYIIGTKVVQHSTDMWGHTTETILDEGLFVDYISGSTYQSGNGGWMKIEIDATPASGATPVSGAPLPGVLSVLLVGGVGAGALKAKKRKA